MPGLLELANDLIVWAVGGLATLVVALGGYLRRIDSRSRTNERILLGESADPNVEGIATEVHDIKQEIAQVSEQMDTQHAEVYDELKDTQRAVFRIAHRMDAEDDIPIEEIGDD